MMKIKALNEASTNDVDDSFNNIISTEAQEQIVMNEYNKALKLLVDKNFKDALSTFQDLVNTELLEKVLKPLFYEGACRPMLSLKYSCYKNIANIYNKLEEYPNALCHYWEASKLDDTDVTLWYKIGQTACRMYDLELSCFAFAQGLKRNTNHWPCLDKIITILFAIPDYISCLFYIFLALKKDPSYYKGLIFYQKIMSDSSFYGRCYIHYNNIKSLKLSVCDQFNLHLRSTLMDEVDDIHKQWLKKFNKSGNFKIDPIRVKSMKEYSWVELGKTLLDTYNNMVDKNRNLNYSVEFQFLSLDSHLPHITTTSHNEVNQNVGKLQESEVDVFSPNSVGLKFEDCDLSHSTTDSQEMRFSADVIHSNRKKFRSIPDNNSSLRKIQTSDSVCYTKENATDRKESEKDKANKGKKRRRSSLCFLTQWAWSGSSKRSSRIRTPIKKDYESDGAILEETLREIFPPDLLPNNIKFTEDESWKNSYDALDAFEAFPVNKNVNHIDFDSNDENILKPNSAERSPVKYFQSKQEMLDVDDFLKRRTEKLNIVTLILHYLESLSPKWSLKWPDDLSSIFIQLYLIVRQHVPVSATYSECVSNNVLKISFHTILLFCELYTDKWLFTNNSASPHFTLNTTGIGLPAADLGCILFHNTWMYVQDQKNIKFLVRLLWLKANLFLYQGEPKNSLCTLELLLQYMQKWQSVSFKSSIDLCNCKVNSIISQKTIKRMLLSIIRSEKFYKIRYLYQEKNYEELVCILKDTFFFSKELNQFVLSKEKPLERDEYLRILLESLCKLQQFEDCFVWAEVCLNEAWHYYLDFLSLNADEEDNQKWLQVILHSLDKLNTCIKEIDVFVVKYLPFNQRTRLVQNLIHILCHQLDLLGRSFNIPIDTVLPWILLHHILQFEDDKRRAKTTSVTKNELQSTALFKVSEENEDEDNEDIPASIVILLKAHKFLGRHGLCCMKNGKLLLFIMELLVPKLNFPPFSHIKEKLRQPLEQVIFCLYGHPSKFISGIRSKPRYLDEHVKTTIALTWEKSQLLFEFYKPVNFPSFVSRKNDSINLDTVVLFKKICHLVPSDSDPFYKLEDMNAFLLGNRGDIPRVEKIIGNGISYIYYLIADHYFKASSNQSWENAIKYYMLDLCLHPEELNSWAGLAMSTSTQMETWLNNFYPDINEEKYLMKAKISRRSYQQAVKLSPLHVTIWTEFGHFLYTVHSFCSRLLKQESDSLSMEKFKTFETQKEEMLDESRDCFLTAELVYLTGQAIDEPQDERWLYQYMLAKIAEKKKEEPPNFLKYYSNASQLLYEIEAQYPKRIIHKNPQNLAVEALEVYYRIHASILKYLEQHEGKSLKKSLAIILEGNLKNCLQSPFASNGLKFDENSIDNKGSNLNLSKGDKLNAISLSCPSNKKKFSNTRSCTINDLNRLNSNDILHIDLMQDVVTLTDEIITKVCAIVSAEKPDSEKQKKDSKLKLKDAGITTYEPEEKKKKLHYLSENPINHTDHYKTEGEKWKSFNSYDKKALEGSEKSDKRSHMLNEKCTVNLENIRNNVKNVYYRRGSHESTTSHTTSSESTSFSSGNTSTSDDSSNSSSSSDSETESLESDTEKKKIIDNEDSYALDQEICQLIKYCVAGLENCALRFPEHYKSVYRLAYFYFNNKTNRSILKCKQLLLGTYTCQFHQNKKIQGLFAERKNTNFFNGIWRIPIHEIDRPGSFASHMSKCVLLLMQVLNETNDSKMLFEVCMQLRKSPDADKKYLRDKEREQLSVQALTLCLQCLRNRIKTQSIQKISSTNHYTTLSDHTNTLLDIYHTYHYMKNIPEYRVSELPKVQKILEDAYVQYTGNLNQKIQGNVFDLAKEFCRIKLRGSKTIAAENVARVPHETNAFIPLNILNGNINATKDALTINEEQKTQKIFSYEISNQVQTSVTTKSQQTSNYKSKVLNNQMEIKPSLSETTLICDPKYLTDNLYSSSAFIEANILSSMLGSNFGVNVMDTAINYFNQVEIYQNILQQYQNNLTVSSSSMNYTNVISSHSVTHEPSIYKPKINFDRMKERPGISITPVVSPVNSLSDERIKSLNTDSEKTSIPRVTICSSKRVKIMPSQKRSISNVNKRSMTGSLPCNETYITAKTFKNNRGDQSVFPESVHVGSTSEWSTSTDKERTISLQHKLKKQIQRPHLSSKVINLVERSSVRNPSPNIITEQTETSTYPLPLRGKMVTVDETFSERLKELSTVQKSKSKIYSSHQPARILENTDKNQAFSVLSHLQQHSHLEIIPQTEHTKKYANEIIKKPRISTLPQSMSISNTHNISVSKKSNRKLVDKQSSETKMKKSCVDTSVEIITLDD